MGSMRSGGSKVTKAHKAVRRKVRSGSKAAGQYATSLGSKKPQPPSGWR